MWRINFSHRIGSSSPLLTICGAMLLSATAMQAQMLVNIVEPAVNATASGSLQVRASVSSVVEVSTVTAEVEGQQVSLKYSQPLNAWTNSVPLAGISFGSHTLVVNARDLFGGTAQGIRTFSVDNPPDLNVVAPLNDTVIRGQIYVDVTASDDGPTPPVIRVFNQFEPFRPNRGLLMIGTNSVKGFVNVTSILSGAVVIQVSDSAGQTRFIPRRAWVELSSNLVENASAPGRILDFSASRTLYTESEDLPVVAAAQFDNWTYGPAQPRIIVHDTGETLATGSPLQSNPVGQQEPTLGFGFVGSSGALLGYSPQTPLNGVLFHWNGSEILNLGPFSGRNEDVQRAGNTVAWRWDLPGGDDKLTLMDLSDTNRQFVISFPFDGLTTDADIRGFHLLPNYDLIYSVSNHIFRSRPASTNEPYLNRATTQLTSGDTGGIYDVSSDGTNVAYSDLSSLPFEIRLITEASEETLATWPSFFGRPAFKVVNGWTAYVKPGSIGQSQVWTRSPAGTQQQRTFFNTSSTLESLGPKGEVTFIYNNARYISLPGVQQPVWVNSGQGRVRWEDGKLLVILGRSILEFRMGQLQCAALAGGSSRLTFTGPNGLSYTVQGSADLQNWTNLWTFTHSTGTISWTNPPANAHLFYRAVTAPTP